MDPFLFYLYLLYLGLGPVIGQSMINGSSIDHSLTPYSNGPLVLICITSSGFEARKLSSKFPADFSARILPRIFPSKNNKCLDYN